MMEKMMKRKTSREVCSWDSFFGIATHKDEAMDWTSNYGDFRKGQKIEYQGEPIPPTLVCNHHHIRVRN